MWITGAVQHQRLAGQEQGSHPGVRCAADAGVQGTARITAVQGARGRYASCLISTKHGGRLYHSEMFFCRCNMFIVIG